MQDPAYDPITLLGIAYDSGFNSKSTFNRIFKQMTGKSPVEYKTDLKKERPTYKLGRQPRFAPLVLHREILPKWSHDKLNRNFMGSKIILKSPGVICCTIRFIARLILPALP